MKEKTNPSYFKKEELFKRFTIILKWSNLPLTKRLNQVVNSSYLNKKGINIFKKLF